MRFGSREAPHILQRTESPDAVLAVERLRRCCSGLSPLMRLGGREAPQNLRPGLGSREAPRILRPVRFGTREAPRILRPGLGSRGAPRNCVARCGLAVGGLREDAREEAAN